MDTKPSLVQMPHTVRYANGRRKAMFQCFCGSVKEMLVDNVQRGRTTSCGCTRLTTYTLVEEPNEPGGALVSS